MKKDMFIILRGRLDWAKIVGRARAYSGNPAFDKGPEWTMDITPDAQSVDVMKKAGIEGKLRSPKGNDKRTEKFLSLRVLENKADGSGKNEPPKITDVTGQPWDQGLIGNGSVADVKVKVKDYGTTVGVYLHAVRILKHVRYDVEEFPPVDEDDEYFGQAEGDVFSQEETPLPAHDDGARTAPNPDDLEDDVPF